MKKYLSEYAPGEVFPGSTPVGKNIYYLGLLTEEENGIGKLDLPSLPTVEEINGWKEQGQLPESSFFGSVARVIVSDKYR